MAGKAAWVDCAAQSTNVSGYTKNVMRYNLPPPA